MIHVSLSADDDELLKIVRCWLDILADENYEKVFENLGYAMDWGEGAIAIKRDINKYRSNEFYPGISEFRVTDWRTAVGGNPDPNVLIRRYEYSESLPLMATIELDLSLNGRWSDLEADFVVTASEPNASEGVLCLEDICSSLNEAENA